MKGIVDILMDRDGMSRDNAIELVRDVRDEIQDAISMGDYILAEDIMYGDLGLEMDYVFEVMGF